MSDLATIFAGRVRKELTAMSEFENFDLEDALHHVDMMSDDELTSMSTSDAADMCISLTRI